MASAQNDRDASGGGSSASEGATLEALQSDLERGDYRRFEARSSQVLGRGDTPPWRSRVEELRGAHLGTDPLAVGMVVVVGVLLVVLGVIWLGV